MSSSFKLEIRGGIQGSVVVWRGGEEKINDPRSMIKGWYHQRWLRHTPWAVWLKHKHDTACTHYGVMVMPTMWRARSPIIVKGPAGHGAEGPRALTYKQHFVEGASGPV